MKNSLILMTLTLIITTVLLGLLLFNRTDPLTQYRNMGDRYSYPVWVHYCNGQNIPLDSARAEEPIYLGPFRPFFIMCVLQANGGQFAVQCI